MATVRAAGLEAVPSFIKPRLRSLADARVRAAPPAPPESCADVHAHGRMAPIRIGYELVSAEGVSADLAGFVDKTLMARATAYWSSALSVRRARQPLRAERIGSGCSKYSFDAEAHCTGALAPTCGTNGFQIPDKYLKARRTCRERCSPPGACRQPCLTGDSKCACDVDEWAKQRGGYCCTVQQGAPECPSTCTVDTATFVGQGVGGGVTCESGCTDHPEGEGAMHEDLHIFVAISDDPPCSVDASTKAYASWCVKDQCDRPIFATINFCIHQLSLQEEDVDEQVSLVIHELAHALAFSSSLFKYFRNPDGTPMMRRDPADQDRFPDEVRWSCDGKQYAFPDPGGGRRYLDLSPRIIDYFPERGLTDCQCPIGKSSMGRGCVVSRGGDRVPSCVVKMRTPRVLAEARAYFGCDTLEGAELENQDTSDCSIVGSHWEMRVFNGELMVAVTGNMPPYISRVTLAVFQDSGWYDVDFSKADPLTQGVHWGYRQGCDFATKKCISDDGKPLWDRAFCTTPNGTACSLDRRYVAGCDIESGPLPPVFDYLGVRGRGSLAEMDYCPSYRARYQNRVCTDPSSDWTPYTNANFMREVFGSSSRCLESTLHADAKDNFRVYAFEDSEFASVRPVCYEVSCGDDGGSYKVQVARGPWPHEGTMLIGTCSAPGEALSHPGLKGSITCAAPAEICHLQSPPHTSAAPQVDRDAEI